jgi:hypothetical protein
MKAMLRIRFLLEDAGEEMRDLDFACALHFSFVAVAGDRGSDHRAEAARSSFWAPCGVLRAHQNYARNVPDSNQRLPAIASLNHCPSNALTT